MPARLGDDFDPSLDRSSPESVVFEIEIVKTSCLPFDFRDSVSDVLETSEDAAAHAQKTRTASPMI
jgi:hypothetical protein